MTVQDRASLHEVAHSRFGTPLAERRYPSDKERVMLWYEWKISNFLYHARLEQSMSTQPLLQMMLVCLLCLWNYNTFREGY
jgi:hypothetical protein